MKKTNNSKALYHFTKLQKKKYSISTKDLNDSLDLGQISPSRKQNNCDKKLHQRTQSCPSIENPIKIASSLQYKGDKCINLEQQRTTRSQGTKLKAKNMHCHSQASIQSLSAKQCSVSIQNLSSILYRKNTNETSLKKLGVATSGKQKRFAINSQLYNKAKIEQQMKKYQLNQQLLKLQKSSQGISVKQHILQNLLHKFQFELVSPRRELIS